MHLGSWSASARIYCRKKGTETRLYIYIDYFFFFFIQSASAPSWIIRVKKIHPLHTRIIKRRNVLYYQFLLMDRFWEPSGRPGLILLHILSTGTIWFQSRYLNSVMFHLVIADCMLVISSAGSSVKTSSVKNDRLNFYFFFFATRGCYLTKKKILQWDLVRTLFVAPFFEESFSHWFRVREVLLRFIYLKKSKLYY